MKTKLKPFTIKKATSRPEITVKAERFQSKKWNPSTLPNVSASKVVDNTPKIQLEVSQFEKDLMRDSYAEFVKKFWSTIVPEKLVWNWHMDEICKRMQWGIMRNIKGLPCEKDLLINISPGTSKSLLTSVMSVAWAWTIKPSLKFICSSYNEDLAFELAGRCRDVIQSVMYQEYFPHVRIREDKNKVSNFATTEGGARMATGITSITGFHAHIIIVDDPINPKSTDSAKELENANKFMSKTLISRMVDKETTFTCLVMQRLHQDDPSARMIKEGRCRKLILPAIDTFPIFPPDLRKYYGEDGLMDRKRLTHRYLNRMKRAEAMGEYAFAGQYGQSPAPPSGGMFKIDRFRTDWDHPAMALPVTERCRFWDKAGTIKGGAYTVGALLVKRGTEKDGGPFFAVEDVIRVQLDSYARNQLIVSTAKEDGLKTIVGLEQEGGSGGKESLEASIRGLYGFNVKWLKPIRDKELRADAYSSQVNGGNVWLKPMTWMEEFKEEHKYFPYSTYKDQVDAVSSAFTIIATRRKKKVGGFSAFSKLRQG